MLHLTPPRKIVLPLEAGEEDAWGVDGAGGSVPLHQKGGGESKSCLEQPRFTFQTEI